MNTRKDANGLFLIVVLMTLLAEIAVSYMNVKGIKLNIVINLLLSQMIILVPGLIYFVVKNKSEVIYRPYKKIKFVTIILTFVLTWLLMPLVTCANLFSQLFTKNEVIGISDSVLELPMIPMVLMIGIFGPFCEEFVFRGLIYTGLKGKSERYIASAVLSGLFFGLMHMNFNQFCYAFVLGIAFALMDECLDSIFVSSISHAIVNTQNVLMLFVANAILKAAGVAGISESYENSMASVSSGNMKAVYVVILYVMLFISAISLLLAYFLLRKMCKIEGKSDRFDMVFRPKKYRENNIEENTELNQEINAEINQETNTVEVKPERNRVLYVYGIIAIFICLFVMFGLEPLMKMIK